LRWMRVERSDTRAWIRAAMNEHARRPVSEEQRISRSSLWRCRNRRYAYQTAKGKPPFPCGKGPGAFGLQQRRPFACVALLRRAPGSLFRSKIGPANADIIYAGLSKTLGGPLGLRPAKAGVSQEKPA